MRDVLIVQLARFGDILQMKRLVLSVMAEPHTQVHLLVGKDLAGITALVYPKAIIHSFPAHATHGKDMHAVGQVLQEAKACLAGLASLSFSAVYILNASPLSHALARFFPPETVIGYADFNGQPTRSQWIRVTERLTGHRASSPLNLADYWAYFHAQPIAPEKVNPVARFSGSGRVGIVLAGQQSRRSLPPEVLGPLVQAVFKAFSGPTLVCLGSDKERPLVRQLMQHLSAKHIEKIEDLTGKTSLLDMPEVLKGLDTLLTPDTGLMHLATHCAVPVQAFFLSSAWCFETGPYGLGHKVWQSVAHCSPCLETVPCPHKVLCLAPFNNKHFVLHQSGQFGTDWPEGLCGLVTGFDPLGVVYKQVDGTDPHTGARVANRALVADYLGFATGGIPQVAGEAFYRERDWELDQVPHKSREVE